MAKKKTAGSETTPTTPAAPAKRRAAAPRNQKGPKSDTPVETAPAETVSGPLDSRDTAPDMGAGAVGGAPTDSAAPYAPTFEQIAEEAYHRYLSRGGSHGADFDDWVEAERRLRDRSQS